MLWVAIANVFSAASLRIPACLSRAMQSNLRPIRGNWFVTHGPTAAVSQGGGESRAQGQASSALERVAAP